MASHTRSCGRTLTNKLHSRHRSALKKKKKKPHATFAKKQHALPTLMKQSVCALMYATTFTSASLKTKDFYVMVIQKTASKKVECKIT